MKTLKLSTTVSIPGGGGSLVLRLTYLLLDPAAPGLNPKKCFQRKKILTLLRLTNGPGERKVDSGLKMLIEPI